MKLRGRGCGGVHGHLGGVIVSPSKLHGKVSGIRECPGGVIFSPSRLYRYLDKASGGQSWRLGVSGRGLATLS